MRRVVFFIFFALMGLVGDPVLAQSDSLNHELADLKEEVSRLGEEVLSLQEMRVTEPVSGLERFSASWVPLITLVVMVVTIIFGWLAVVQNRRLKSYGLVIDITNEYASREMLDAILLLRDWERKHQGSEHGFAEVFADLRQSDYESVKDVDLARRKLSHFYSRLHLLHKNRVASGKEILDIIPAGKIAVLFELIEPRERTMGINYDTEKFSFFENLIKVL